MPGRRPLAVLILLATAGCTPLDATSLEPIATRRPTATPTPTAAPLPSDDGPSAPASAAGSPFPTPVSDAPEALDIELTGCPGGVVVDWSPATHPEFHHYTALRSVEQDVNVAYPPIAPAVDWGQSYATDRFVTSAVDTTLIPSDALLHYRVMGYDEVNRPVAASPVKSARPVEVVDLGALVVTPGEDEEGSTLLDWGLFGGLGGCFSAYHVLVGPPGADPVSTLTTISQQSTSELETPALHAGQAYAIRIEAIRATTLGSFVVAHTDTVTYTVPVP